MNADRIQQLKMTTTKDNDKGHCFECAGKAKAKGEACSTCDGEGNLKEVTKAPTTATTQSQKQKTNTRG